MEIEGNIFDYLKSTQNPQFKKVAAIFIYFDQEIKKLEEYVRNPFLMKISTGI